MNIKNRTLKRTIIFIVVFSCVLGFSIKTDTYAAEKNIVPITSKVATDSLYESSKVALTERKEVPWKTVICIGDSITEGVQSGKSKPWPITWPQVLGSALNVQVENAGIGGSTIWSGGAAPMSQRILNHAPVDAVFVMGGLNDWFYGNECVLGDKLTHGTFSGDLNIMFYDISITYPNADVFIISPLEPAMHLGVEPYHPLNDIRNIEKELCSLYGYHYIDLYGKNIMSNIDVDIRSNYYSDSCHPNDKGYEILGKIIAQESLSVIDK